MKSITKTALERCRSYLVESEKSAATAEKYMRDLRAFAAWIKGAELCRILRRYAAERNIPLDPNKSWAFAMLNERV